jgi:BON domain
LILDGYLEQQACLFCRVQALLLEVPEGEVQMKNRQYLVVISLLLVALAATACSMNRQLPEAADEEAMVVEVKAAVNAVAPGSGINVDVTDGGRVTLTGHADSAAQRDAIVARVRDVNGVRSVDASGVHVQ